MPPKTIVSVSEKPYRSIFKAFSWRMIATLTTMVISWFITGNLTVAFSIGSIEVFAKMGLYYMHERAWARSKFGLYEITPPDYQI